ncbi:peptidylprolyl isomerase [Teredinibacter turnerae]|uniref:FKBP-type peptidyl-prolyl cis-trans isomerase n=1 Tax=Teredinibacter turnerae TaxID=2426 RepID=UPI00036CFAAA|nr:peptidylprolyl isomerase [Teredinibacter turnerae]
MKALPIGPNTKVTLHFALKLGTGDVVDSNFEADAAQFTVGDGNLLPGFEEVLFGLIAGDEKTFVIPPEKAFGQPNPNNVQDVKREEFAADFPLEVGLVIGFSDAAGAENPAVIRSFDDQTVVVDFNHPLAGETITFDVRIIDVAPVVTH